MKLVDISLYIYTLYRYIYIYYVSFHLFQHQVPTCGRGMLWLTPKAISNLRRNSNPSCPRLSSRETCNAKNSSRSRHILSPVSESIKVSPQHLLSPVMRTMQDNASCHRNKWVDSILSLRTSKLCATGSDMFFSTVAGSFPSSECSDSCPWCGTGHTVFGPLAQICASLAGGHTKLDLNSRTLR